MGGVVESCKRHANCCNKEDDKYIATMSDMSPESSEEEEVLKPNDRVSIPKNVYNMKVKINDLVLQHETSPWLYYEELNTLGSGTFGTVKKVCLISNKNQIRAMKIIPKENILDDVDKSKIIDEILILKNLDHPNIMKIYECYVDTDNFYIISDFCDQGDLLGKMTKLGKMNQIVVKFIMDQVLNAVSYLHSKNVLHGDIKLENILLYKSTKNKDVRRFTTLNVDINNQIDLQREINRKNSVSKKKRNYVNDMLNYEIKLIDFGCSKYFVHKKHRKLTGIIGTSIYCSPEVIDNRYDEKCDEWSCGVLMYMLLAGYPPFQGENEDEIFENIKKCNYSLSKNEFKYVTDNCKDLIKKLLQPNSKKRIKACDALKHDFFTEYFDPNLAMTENKDLNILKKLINFKKPTSKFHETIYYLLCKSFINVDEEKIIRTVFRYIDKNGKNKLSKEDLNNCLKEINIVIPENFFNEIFITVDANGSGFVEYQEFLNACCDKDSLITSENLKSIFDSITGGENDFINAEDIKKFIFHDNKIQDNTFNDYLGQFGMTKNDKLKFDDFFDMIKHGKKFNEDTKEVRVNNIIEKTTKNYGSNAIIEDTVNEDKDDS